MKYALLGLAVVAAHAIGFVALAGRAGTDLVVEVHAPLASPRIALDGTVPAALADRVESRLDGDGPGLRRRTWTTHYRGGFERAVAATQLVGPFQDPAAPPCSGRVIVGQRLLDDGRAGPGTIAHAMAAQIDASLRGEHVFGAGDYRRVDKLSLQWARAEQRPLDRPMLGGDGAPHGYVRASATIVFDRIDVKIAVALVPRRDGDKLAFRIAARAELDLGHPVVQWLSDTLGGDRLATRLARRQIDDALVTALAPPPPFALPDGQELAFVFCDDPIDIVDTAYGALPFAVRIGRVAGAPAVLPPRFGRGARATPAAAVALALDLDLDALDAILYELWRTGWLDRRLAEIGLDRRFNSDPIVTEYLSIRLSPLRLALPPVIEAAPDGRLRLAADARVAIADGATTTTGRAFGALRFAFAPGPMLGVAVDLDALELTCERSPTVLVPCYADLVAALRDRGADFHGALTRSFADLLAQIFVGRRVGDRSLPAELAIRGVVPSLAHERGKPPSLHLALDAALQ